MPLVDAKRIPPQPASLQGGQRQHPSARKSHNGSSRQVRHVWPPRSSAGARSKISTAAPSSSATTAALNPPIPHPTMITLASQSAMTFRWFPPRVNAYTARLSIGPERCAKPGRSHSRWAILGDATSPQASTFNRGMSSLDGSTSAYFCAMSNRFTAWVVAPRS
jgi:hypothetical protein